MFYNDVDAVYNLPDDQAATVIAVALARLTTEFRHDSLMPVLARDELALEVLKAPKKEKGRTMTGAEFFAGGDD